MTFQKKILYIAVILLIVILTIIGVAVAFSDDSFVYPPNDFKCPDYWVSSNVLQDPEVKSKLDSKLQSIDIPDDVCVNVKLLGTCKDNLYKDFNEPPYNNPGKKGSKSGYCAKSKWANKCYITWDGITNRPNVCRDDIN